VTERVKRTKFAKLSRRFDRHHRGIRWIDHDTGNNIIQLYSTFLVGKKRKKKKVKTKQTIKVITKNSYTSL